MSAFSGRSWRVPALVGLVAVLGSAQVGAQSATTSELLQKVKQGRYAEAQENKEREARFRAEKSQQEAMLREAQSRLAGLERQAADKEKQFDANEARLAEVSDRLREAKGALNELFGHITTTAGDMVSIVEVSPVSAQYPGRAAFFEGLIEKISRSDKLPTIEEIERLWFELQREMVESGRVVRFPATVVAPDGGEQQQDVVRVGSFNLVTTTGDYLSFSGGRIEQLARQPERRYRKWAAELAAADDGLQRFGADPTGPTGGSLLSALIATPNLEERWQQGGYVGYAITALGVIALVVALWRLVALSVIGSRVRAQLKSARARSDNPLGRLLAIHEANPAMDTETLELKLSEQVIREIPGLEKFQGALKIIAAVAPLMGLLGTVTGMIVTFQAITIYGAGDPKAMASGISTALVTTVLGLLVAIPTVLLHTMVASRSRRIIQVMEEQATGIIAEHTEAARAR
jgi:biopolymer transport protein ExbB